MWVEFTDPTNTVAVLTYSFGSDPFLGFELEEPTKTQVLGVNTLRLSTTSPAGGSMSSINTPSEPYN